MKPYEDFSRWLNSHLEGQLPPNIIAINFNLYEGSNETYDTQMIGSDEFDVDDQDWVCSEMFSTEEDIFYMPKTREIMNWQDGLDFIKQIVQKYLDEGKYAYKLKEYQAVGIGFVDGDIDILYQEK